MQIKILITTSGLYEYLYQVTKPVMKNSSVLMYEQNLHQDIIAMMCILTKYLTKMLVLSEIFI
jgi:hypothetical protein